MKVISKKQKVCFFVAENWLSQYNEERGTKFEDLESKMFDYDYNSW